MHVYMQNMHAMTKNEEKQWSKWNVQVEKSYILHVIS